MEEEITFKTTLVFWKLYETNLSYSNQKISEILKSSQYGGLLYNGYYFENEAGQPIPLKWIAKTGKFFTPHCFKLQKAKFKCINNTTDVQGDILIDAHIYPEGVLVLQARLDFDKYQSIEQLIISSIPDNIIISENKKDMGKWLDEFADGIISFLKTKIKRKKQVLGEKATPWHHNWIWWESNPKTDIKEFDMDGKYFNYALGMCTRSDKWRCINCKNYSSYIEDVYNLSPYEGNCVYITHPGNCIIPGEELCDPNSIKNTLIDVLFAAEVGNVQRYLKLNHLQDINFRSLEIQELLYQYHKAKLATKELIVKLEKVEQQINEIVLEINKNLQVYRVPRLLFTSVFKTKIMHQMIHVLHGDKFFESLTEIIYEIKDSINRQRSITAMKVDAEENTFLRNLQVVFIIGLIAQMITLFYGFTQDQFNLVNGIIFTSISVVLSLVILFILRRFK